MAKWALITSESGAGGSACAAGIVGRLAGRGVASAGFLQRKGVDGKGRTRFELVRLRGGESAVLAVDGVEASGPGEERHCRMAFRKDGFDAAARWLEEDAAGADVLVFDGVGKVEAAGRGHCRALRAALGLEGKVVLVFARARPLFRVVHRLGLDESEMLAALEVPADGAALDAFVESVASAVGGREGR